MKKIELPQLPPNVNSNLTREQAIDILLPLHRIADRLTTYITNKNYKIEITILSLSVVTSGGIWVMLSASFPSLAAWFGAAFSTMVTGLTIYQLTPLGPKTHVEEAYAVYQSTVIELGLLRGGATFDSAEFWDLCYKRVEPQLRKLINDLRLG